MQPSLSRNAICYYCINELIKLRMKELSKKKYLYELPYDKNVIWDDTIAVIRNFQAEFAKCVKELLTERSFSRWLNYMSDENSYIIVLYHQYLERIHGGKKYMGTFHVSCVSR